MMRTRIGLTTAVCSVSFLAVALIGSTESRAVEPPPSKVPSIESLTAQFVWSDWPSVDSAKDTLESLEALAIPSLISLLKRDDHVPLKDTADLIYPGASEFAGHGRIVDYDIDWLSVRAGWALEAMTFQAFGFREGALDHDALLKSAIAGKVGVPLSEVASPVHDADTKRERRSRAAAKASEWWAAAAAQWNRFDALVEALKSGEPSRQIAALSWLRHGTTRCDGLTQESFTQLLLPTVRRLTGSENVTVKEQAEDLARDFDANEWRWLQRKPSRAHLCGKECAGNMTNAELAAAIKGHLAPVYPNIQVRVEPSKDDPSRISIYFVEESFSSLYPRQRFHYLVRSLPESFQEEHLSQSQWFELAPGERPQDLQYLDEELVAEIAPEVLRVLKKTGFFLALDDAMAPREKSLQGESCQGDFQITKRILAEKGLGQVEEVDMISDACHVLMSKGAYCDCEVLYNVHKGSRLGARAWQNLQESTGHPKKP